MKKKVLIIEDDPRLRDAIQVSIEEDGYEFYEAASVQAGIAVITQHHDIRVIILDLEFPGDKGVTFLEYIQDKASYYRIIVLTAHDELLAAENASRYKVFAYQAKLTRLAVQSLKFAVERAFQDIEGEILKQKITAHLQIQQAINKNQDLGEILNLICRHLVTLIRGFTCHIRVFDLKKGDFELKGCAGPFPNMQEIFAERKPLGDQYSGKVAETGVAEIIDALQEDPPFIAQKEAFLKTANGSDALAEYFAVVKSAYILPVITGISDENVDAILNINSDNAHYFSDKDIRSLVDEFANHISLAVTKHWLNVNKTEIHKGYKDISGMMSEVSSELKGEYDLNIIYDIVHKRISNCIHPEIVSIFLYNDETGLLENVVEYREDHVARNIPQVHHNGESLAGWVYTSGKPVRLLDFTKDNRFNLHCGCDTPCGRCEHYLGAPMRIGKQIIGIIQLVNKKSEYYDFDHSGDERTLLKRGFTEEDQAFLEIAAGHLAVAIRNTRSHQETRQWIDKLTMLNQVMQEMTEAHSVDELLKLILHRAQQLIDFKYGLITRVDPVKGEQHFVAHIGGTPEYHSLPLWEGITGKALADMTPIRVDDVQSDQWQQIYTKRWADIRSELAVPIFIGNKEVRVGHEILVKPKRFGVINLENPATGSFSKSDEDILVLLARHAAILIERLEYEHKTASLNQIKSDIAGKQDWDEIILMVMQAITDTLGYDYVNISLVDRQRNRIKTEYVSGIPLEEISAFKKMADHSLDSNDIQAHIVRSRKIEVPDSKDPRLDHDIVVRFRHRSLLRVFIPMITAADNRVIGTVETGYQRKYREYIYEKDIQILQEFIDYAVHALEQRKKGLLDQISHEFRAPIVGIRSNASFLRRRFPELKSSLIRRKFSDILADSELLLYQVKELEYILGRTPPVSKRERTFLFRDVIIKTIKQLKPLVAEASLNISNIEYDSADVFKIGPLYIDKSKINQVVYNLLMNSIKYAEEDADQFKIRISVDKSGEMYVIQFKDWGIGIRPELKEKIFEDGFRAPEAMRKNVSGSGLGLTISQKIMRELGGDLRLTHYSKPTVFQILLPTKLEEIPNDPIRR